MAKATLPFPITAEQKQTLFGSRSGYFADTGQPRPHPDALSGQKPSSPSQSGVDRLQRLHYKRFYLPRPLAMLIVVVFSSPSRRWC